MEPRSASRGSALLVADLYFILQVNVVSPFHKGQGANTFSPDWVLSPDEILGKRGRTLPDAEICRGREERTKRGVRE